MRLLNSPDEYSRDFPGVQIDLQSETGDVIEQLAELFATRGRITSVLGHRS